MLIFRRTNCIITASGIVTLCKRPYSVPVESGLQSALNRHTVRPFTDCYDTSRGELSYLAPLGSENISAPYFKHCFFRGWGVLPPPSPQTESNTTPPSPKTEITNILFYILNFASIIKFKM